MTQRRPIVNLLVAVLAIGLLAAACGDDDDGGGGTDAPAGLSKEEQAFADAFAAALQDEEGLSVSAEEADCMGTAVMAELGVEPFEEAGVKASDIEPGGDDTTPGALLGDDAVPQAQAEAIVRTWSDDCVDLVDVLIESAGSELDLDPEGKDCLTEGLGEEDLAVKLLAGTFTSADGSPDEETFTNFLGLLEECEGSADDGGILVQSIADSLAADGSFTDEQAECLAQGVVDEIGSERLGELFAGGGFEGLDPAAQNEVTGALLQAAGDCDVPLDAFAE